MGRGLTYADSDAMFRSPEIHVSRHLAMLSLSRPFGVLTNQPWDDSICSGYWFMYRPMRDLVYDVEDFILEWWNEDWANTLFQLYDQSTLRRLIGRSTRDEERESSHLPSFHNVFSLNPAYSWPTSCTFFLQSDCR